MSSSKENGSCCLLEVCASDIRSVIAADQGGADRIELCDNLPEGGTTPSIGTVQIATQSTSLPVRVLIRPRGGDFCYSASEVASMIADIEAISKTGVDGFVLGALTKEAEVDIHVMELLISAIDGKPWTFHRAIDFCKDPFSDLEIIIRLGADTILTSGQAKTAIEGIPVIRKLNELAAERINIMAGAGLTIENIAMVRYQSGCNAFHLSGRSSFQNYLLKSTGATLNTLRLHPDSLSKYTDDRLIAKVVRLLNQTQDYEQD